METLDYTPIPKKIRLVRAQGWKFTLAFSDISETININDYDITAIISSSGSVLEMLSVGNGIDVAADGTFAVLKKDWTELGEDGVFTPPISTIPIGLFTLQIIFSDSAGREISPIFFYVEVVEKTSDSSVERASSDVQFDISLDGGLFIGMQVTPVSDRIEWRTTGLLVEVRNVGETTWHTWADLSAVPYPVPLGGYNATTNVPALSAIPSNLFTEGSFYDIINPGVLGFSGVNFPSGTAVTSGDQLKKNGTQWLLIQPKLLQEKKFLKRSTVQNLSVQEITLLKTLYTLDIEVPAGSIGDDWRIKYVATVPTNPDLVTNFKYCVMIRNYTTGVDFILVNRNVGFAAPYGNGFYSGTVTSGGVTVKYNVEIDWNYLLTLGANYQYYNEGSTNNLKLNTGVFEKTSNLEGRVATVELLSAQDLQKRALDLEAKSKDFQLPIGNFTAQSIVIITDKYYTSTGVLTTLSGFKCAEITVSDVDRILITSIVSGDALYGAIFLDAAGKVISAINRGTNGVNTPYTDAEIDIPARTVKILLNSTNAGALGWKKLIAMTKAAEKSVVDAIGTRVSAIEAAIADFVSQTISVTANSYYNPSGVLTAFAGYTCINIACTDADRFKVSCVVSGTELHLAMFLNSAGGIISKINRGVNGQLDTYVDQLITPPAGTTNILFSSSNYGSISLKKLQLQPNYASKAYVDGLIAYFDYLNSVKSKTIHVLGTSIPEGGGHYELACTRLEATLINKALGSSMVRSAKKDGSIAGINWRNYCYALTHTIAKKQQIIDDWSTVRTSLTGSTLDPVPTTLTTAEQTKILGASYENRLLPYLNGTFQMPSVFVFDHGHNDYAYDTYNDFITMPTNTRDVNTFIGGINFLIDLILQFNPRARIAFVGHYENDRKAQISVAQTVLAEKWDFPFLKLWEKLGWTQTIVAGTAGIRTTVPYSTYNTGTGDMTILNIWLPDELHIGSDTTGKAKEHAARHLQDFLRVL